MLDIIIDSLKDSIKLLPFLFLTYLLMEFLEHRTGAAAEKRIKMAGRTGPLWGGLLGVMPQCGFSAAASSLYAGRVITAGTLLAVFLSTSDEMLPIMISRAVAPGTIIKILAAKAALGIISGFILDLTCRYVIKRPAYHMDVHKICQAEHCHCENGILHSAFMHTVKIFAWILIISLALNLVIGFIGEEALEGLFVGIPIAGEIIAALIGLIPNCASSVVITQLYLDQVIGAGPMMAGLLVNAGVGLVVLFRLNHDRRKNLEIVGVLYGFGVFWGILTELLGIIF